MIKKFLSILALAFFFINSANAATSNWHENQSNGAQVRLIGSFYQPKVDNKDAGERKLIIGLHFKVAKGWKIYAPSAQGEDSLGMPPSIDFAGSKNYTNHQIIWPQPQIGEEKIGNNSLKYFFYQDEIVIPIELAVEKIGEPVDLTLKLDYGLCRDVCIPASESFSLKITEEIDVETLQKIQKFYPQKIVFNIAEKDEVTAVKNSSPNHSITLIYAIILAIFGGVILNIMPCVLPILSIKLISIIKHSGNEVTKVKMSFLFTTIGILSCFVIFAFLASFIKLSGNSLGWGLQFQNPRFLIFLIVILMLMIGNLLGVFEIYFNQILATILNKKITQEEKKQNVFLANFLSGILAVLLATPCSAPFLGAAISFALTQNYLIIFIVFISIGIGFALPYITLFFAPQLVSFLPKPGSWISKIKQLMAGLLAATAIWLIYVLAHNIGFMPAFLAGALATAILACFKIKTNFLKFFAFVAAISLTFSMPLTLQQTQMKRLAEHDRIWRNFDETEINVLVAQGKTVIVDITADWCITCKFNKFNVLNDEEVIEKLKGKNIVAMRGDITKPNEEILNFLHKNDRFAIPFNAVYGPNAKTGLLASELLNKKELLALIDKAS